MNMHLLSTECTGNSCKSVSTDSDQATCNRGLAKEQACLKVLQSAVYEQPHKHDVLLTANCELREHLQKLLALPVLSVLQCHGCVQAYASTTTHFSHCVHQRSMHQLSACTASRLCHPCSKRLRPISECGL